MRRKKDDKRVLRGRPDNNKRNNSIKSRYSSRQPVPTRQRKRERGKTSRTLLILFVLALIGFIIGAGFGVFTTFDIGSNDEAPQYENVTVEMTSNLSDVEPVYYDSNLDSIDYNDQQELVELNLTNNTTTMGY